MATERTVDKLDKIIAQQEWMIRVLVQACTYAGVEVKMPVFEDTTPDLQRDVEFVDDLMK